MDKKHHTNVHIYQALENGIGIGAGSIIGMVLNRPGRGAGRNVLERFLIVARGQDKIMAVSLDSCP